MSSFLAGDTRYVIRDTLVKIVFAFLLVTGYWLLVTHSASAQSLCQVSDLHQGLISAPQGVSGVFGNQNQICIIGSSGTPLNEASYRDFKVPSYEDLENQFYSQAPSSVKQTTARPNGDQSAFNGNNVWLQPTDFTIGTAAVGSGVQIIFVRGNLNITKDITYATADPYSGIVFITSGDININSLTVQTVNAVLISFGKICTAWEGITGCSAGTNYTPRLTINGSLISLNKNDIAGGTILLRRNLLDNSIGSAELINKQAKFLYILKNGLLTKDLILIQEDSNYIIPADPSLPPPPPAASPCPTTNPLSISTITSVGNCILGI